MHNEPGSSRDGQPINVDAPEHVVIPQDVEVPSGELDVGTEKKIPTSNLFQTSLLKNIRPLNHSCSRHNLLSHWYHVHKDESTLNSSREKRARETVKFECSSCSFQ